MTSGFADLMYLAAFILVLPMLAGGISAALVWPRGPEKVEAKSSESADRAA